MATNTDIDRAAERCANIFQAISDVIDDEALQLASAAHALEAAAEDRARLGVLARDLAALLTAGTLSAPFGALDAPLSNLVSLGDRPSKLLDI